MSESLHLSPADFRRENTAIELINLVVDERMTVAEAADAVGIARSTWYYWVEHGKVDHLLRKKREEVRSRLKLKLGSDS